MLRHRKTSLATCCLIGLLCGCGESTQSNDQPLDVSKFNEFVFAREISIDSCFQEGDLIAASLRTQGNNRVLSYTLLEQDIENTECLATPNEEACLSAGEPLSRVLNETENQRVDELFRRIVIAGEPNELCSSRIITPCGRDEFAWDAIAVSGDPCESSYLLSGADVIQMLEELRDGSLAEASEQDTLIPATAAQPLELVAVDSFAASDRLLTGSGDFVVIQNQDDLDAVLLYDGAVEVDFETETAVAAVVVRAPCQEFTAIQATEGILSISMEVTMDPQNDCGFLDLGSLDAYLIVMPKTFKRIRGFVNGSELSEFSL